MLGVLFSTVVDGKVVARPVKIGILFLTSFIFVLRLVLVAKLLISGILSNLSILIYRYLVYLL